MRRRERLIVLGLMAGCLVPAAARKGWAADLVIVRTYDAVGVPPSALAEARGVAAAILTGADLRISWLVCSAPAGAESPCSVPLKPHEVVVRIVAAPPQVSASALGSALVDISTGAGALATIYEDHVEATAAHAGGDAGSLLGRTMAHEIGHLLIGNGGHAGGGLMRGRWSDREVRGHAVQDWTFSPADVALIHQHLLGMSDEDAGAED